MRPLAGLTVIDLTHMLSGPFCTMTLTDLGARTIKVEPPGRGEGTRALLADDPRHSVNGMGAYFVTLNRGKESVAIDLKQPKGVELFYKIIAKADIVVDNFSAGVTKRLRIDYEHLSAINPRIICCSISGFGLQGPSANKTSFDLVAQGIGGGMTLTGEADGRALRSGIPIGDLGGGLYAVIGILAAIRAREVTNRGQLVDISMVDCQVGLLNYMATMYMMSGEQPGRAGNAHFAHVPYDTFTTQTRDLIICVLTDAQWRAVTDVVGVDALRDKRFDTRFGRLSLREELLPILGQALENATCEHWLEVLAARGIPCAPVNDIAHALTDEQVLYRNMVQTVPISPGVSVKVPGNPVKLSDAAPDDFGRPPTVGEHTASVLTQLCEIDTKTLADLHDAGIINHVVTIP